MILLLIVFIGDSNTLYGMDITAGLFPVEWDSSFMFPFKGFRTLQGCLDLENWYQKYQMGFYTEIYRNMRFFYEYGMVNDYRFSKEMHRFAMRFINGVHYLNIYVVPNFSKIEDEAGIGYGIELRNLWFEANVGINQFDNNYYLSKVDLETETPFVRYPVIAWIRLYHNQRGYTKLDLRKMFTGEKKVIQNGIHLGSIYHQRSQVELRNYFIINERIGTDLYFIRMEFDGWLSESSISFVLPNAENYYENTLFGVFYLRFTLGNTDLIKVGPSIQIHRFYSDTLNYLRRDLMFNTFWKRSFGIPFVNIGLQFSSRTIMDTDISRNTEIRGVVELGFDFNRKTHLSIIEGIEIDDISRVKNGLNYLHNHTFIRASFSF